MRGLFSKENAHRRRVACVAYVGADCLDFIPYPKELEVYCWPKAGGTSPLGISRLLKAETRVRFVDALHTKVFWVEGVGCLVGSANLSRNALDEGGLQEFGLLFDSSQVVDIDRILRQRTSRRVTSSELRRLEVARAQLSTRWRGKRPIGTKEPDFTEWLSLPSRLPWKLCWADGEQGAPKSVLEFVKEHVGLVPKGGWNWSHARKGEYGPGDWLLSFDLSNPSYIEWLFVTDVFRKPSRERYAKDWPFNAVQLGRLPSQPPFRLTRAFRSMFHKALHHFGHDAVREAPDSRVPKRLLTLLATEAV